MQMRKFLLACAVLAVLGLAAYGWTQRTGDTAASDSTALAPVARGTICKSVACTGRVVANLDVDIKCKASGEVVKLPFDVSDQVTRGDLLLQIDPIDEERMVKQAEASLAASRARLETARIALAVARSELGTERLRAQAAIKSAAAKAQDTRAKSGRMKELLGKKLASAEEAETAETTAAELEVVLECAKIRLQELVTQEQALGLEVQDVTLAEAQVTSDELNLEIRRKGLADTNVASPIDGVVSAREVQLGQIISSGISNVGGGTTAMTVSDLSRVFVLANVDESDIGEIRAGQPADITADAFPGRTFPGQVVRIATEGVNTSNVVTFEVKIEVMTPDKALLKPEMTANVCVTTARSDDALLVPVGAVVLRAGKYYAEVCAGPRVAGQLAPSERQVEVGLRGGSRVEITGGLSEGEQVVLHEAPSSWTAGKQTMPPPPPMMPPGGPR